MSGGPPMIVTAVAQTDTTGFIKGMPMGLDASGEWFRATTGNSAQRQTLLKVSRYKITPALVRA